MGENNISSQYLLNRINSNESLSDEERNITIQPNLWYYHGDGNRRVKIIKINFDDNIFNGVLDKSIDCLPYIYILSIAFYLIKIEKYKEKVEITEQEAVEVMTSAVKLLNKYKYYSLYEKDRLLAITKSKEERKEILNSFDRENIETINKILSKIKIISNTDIKEANEMLKSFNTNLDWDAGFIIKLLSFDFSSLKNLTYGMRKELLNKIDELIYEYKEAPSKNKIEKY
jgi:hypothetical protein